MPRAAPTGPLDVPAPRGLPTVRTGHPLARRGEVGDPRPLQAIDDVLLRGERFDGIVLSTLPPGISRWLRLDLPHRVEAQLGLPVTHLVGEPEPAAPRRGG